MLPAARIGGGFVQTTFTNGNEAPIYSVEIIVTYIEGGQERTQRFDRPMLHPGTHEERWGSIRHERLAVAQAFIQEIVSLSGDELVTRAFVEKRALTCDFVDCSCLLSMVVFRRLADFLRTARSNYFNDRSASAAVSLSRSDGSLAWISPVTSSR
ncbi:MAG: hypothetical protein M3N53_12920 [Actinomycetota bacterium]|nr:hypothetical protein [Actinomycetota bacterium]